MATCTLQSRRPVLRSVVLYNKTFHFADASRIYVSYPTFVAGGPNRGLDSEWRHAWEFHPADLGEMVEGTFEALLGMRSRRCSRPWHLTLMSGLGLASPEGVRASSIDRIRKFHSNLTLQLVFAASRLQ